MIPLLKGMRGPRSTIVTQIVERRTSPASEALRSVFTAITLGSLDRAPRIIAVTAATPGEGKTTFAASMGALLAGMNAARRVLVVDLDLRQARMAEAFNITDRRGTIDEYLLGTKTLQDCLHKIVPWGVDIICARPDTPNAPDVLESEAMKKALSHFLTSYDLVILDSPPIMAVSDARSITSLADYTVFLLLG